MALSDRFELGRALGQGTFGITHLATELASGRMVAIKCLSLGGLPEWKPVELFEREARVLRSLDHPGVPAFIDAFEDDDPVSGHRFYIVSEYIEGPTLSAEIDSGRRWSPAQARALFRALLETLAYLHSLSPRVIHRDIKPGNVVMRPDDRPVLVDFGSVRDLAARQVGGGMTIAGTAGYMAPEQAMGISDVRSDLYGLAATLAHVLTHVHPSELPRQGLRPQLGDLAGDVGLGRILERLLDPDPERRHGSAADVLRLLGDDGDGDGEEAAPLALVRRAPGSTAALAHRVDIDAAIARLADTPRKVSPEVQGRLNYVRAMRGALPISLSGLVGGTLAGVIMATSGWPRMILPMIFLSLGWFFVAPLIERAKVLALYASGNVTRGRILQARSENGALHVRYTYRHGDQEHSGQLLTNDALVANRVEADTPVLVFFDPERPGKNAGLLPNELPAELREPSEE